MKFPWNLWVMLLGGVNMVGGLVYITTLEGQLALAGLMLAFMIMWAIYIKKGFVRLLGLGHLIAWPPLMVWYFNVIALKNPEGAFKYWLISVLTVNGVSLVIDLVDVVRYSMGENQPMNA
ncbi:MAG: hypothetical protein GWM98_27365 [Nitrospinaceae bacterium]|nr:hypothetical protein [Nitrospinaceae bacterium]NIU47010.1 hypothetical protein [Nitrospinaceae bacterium]NIU99211.1 hypothetical protein [Nitrospinaceae bacterium]NIW61760.1 hypothetical protein [Nitrospinaceae bacterium]NIY18312.1 hypothetical protein [Nitrospinaceae bacterium]